MTMLRCLLAACLALPLFAAAANAAGCDAPVSTLKPGTMAGAPDETDAFAGIWQGQWPVAVHDHVMPICARLYVQIIATAAATVEQCTGSNREARRRPECKQYAAQIDGNVMTFTDLQGTVYTFTMADVGGMKGEAVTAEHRSVTVFVKQP